MLRAVPVVALLLVLPASARADFTIADTARPTTVSAYAGHLVFSQWDGNAYRLVEAHGSIRGEITTPLPIAPRSVPFDADVGPGPDGTPTIVYSRCATEPKPGAPYAPARGCDVYKLPLGATAETKIAGVSTSDASEFLPTIWRTRIGFARVYDQLPYVYVRGANGPSKRQPGGMRGDTGLPGPTSLDLAGTRLALTWGARVNRDDRTETRLDTTTGGHRLLEFTTGQGDGNRVASAFVSAGRVWWVHESDDGPQHVYRRWRITTEKLEEATIPDGRRPTEAIAPQSASSVFWSQPTRVGGDGFVVFRPS